NQYRYPLIVTVTCEFTRFDNPYRPTAGEYTYWNPTGGAISLITTTRQIGVTTGQDINEGFSSYLYGYGPNSSEETTIAEALRRAKNAYNSQTLMVFYIGDPALKLAIPKPKIILTKVNDVPTDSSTFVFNALSKVKLSGEVRDLNGDALLSNYNGDIAVQIFDKSINRSTLANDNTRDGSNNLIIMNFQTLGETIFRGNATVTNGLFEIEFIVPKDISIPVGNGRISFYAKSPSPVLQDQTGYDTSILIGGINENAPEDNIGPRVRLYMNDESFISGGITNASPIFLAFLEDENGINTASGIGHDIVAILDGDENNPYILNDYYETELNDYTKGKVRFPFRDLAPGLHTITFRAWDVYNNPVSAEIQFIVVGDETISLTNVLNYPNPFVSYTQFWFSHNRPFEPLDVQVQVFTITGKIVKTINQVINTEGFLSREITWDGRDDFGDKIGKGVYVYKLTVKSNLTNKKVEKIEKLVIL
ncbi:MAG: peptidase C25, partial [Bacteroidetes bacterium HGW-Bacteroidetes-23]